MRVKIRLYAAARELAGQDRVELDLPHALSEPTDQSGQSTHALENNPTVRQLRQALAKQVPALAPLLPQVLFALDTEYATDDTPLTSEMEIACIPPVSGG